MINFSFVPAGPKSHYYIVKVSCKDVIGLNILLGSKLNDIQVASIIASFLKPSYQLEIMEIPYAKKFPSGYSESYSIDSVISLAARLRFTETTVQKEARVVYIDKVVSKEL